MKVFLFLLIVLSIILLGSLYYWLETQKESSKEKSTGTKIENAASSAAGNAAHAQKQQKSGYQTSSGTLVESSNAGVQTARSKAVKMLNPARRKRKKKICRAAGIRASKSKAPSPGRMVQESTGLFRQGALSTPVISPN